MITLIAVAAAVLILVLFGYIMFRRGWEIPDPDVALIIVSKAKGEVPLAQEKVDGSDQAVINSIEEDRLEGLNWRIATSATWVNPVTSKAFPLQLASRSTTFSADAYDKDKIGVSVGGVLLYKVGDGYDAMTRAARRFLSVDEQGLNRIIQDLVTGQIRALVGGTTVDSLIVDREKLMNDVRAATREDMAKLGLRIDSLTIQEIKDDNNYIQNLGRPRQAEASRAAAEAEAKAREAEEQANQAAERTIAESRRETEVQKSRFQADQDKAKAEADQAGPLARAEAEKAVVAKETEVAELNAARAEKEYDAEVRKRADADAYREVTLAKADKDAAVLRAEADAEFTKRSGNARATALKAEGTAEAARIEAIGLAEAKATEEKAKALAEHGHLLIEEKLVSQMPEVARAVSDPLAEIDNLVVLEGQEGYSKFITGGISAVQNVAETLMRAKNGELYSKEETRVERREAERKSASKKASPQATAVKEKDKSEFRAPSLEEMRKEEDKEVEESDQEKDAQFNLAAVEELASRFRELEDPSDYVRLLQNDPETKELFRTVAEDEDLFESFLAALPADMPSYWKGGIRQMRQNFLG